jgi:hypothetical protein
MVRERSILQQTVEGESDEAVVAAMSRLLLTFSRLVATQLAAFPI